MDNTPADTFQTRISAAKNIAAITKYVHSMTLARCIQELALQGHSQREISRRLKQSKSTVNRLATTSITYTPEGNAAAGLCDAIESATWGTPAMMRQNYMAITGSADTCPRCGSKEDSEQRNFCPNCRFPAHDAYLPPAVPGAVPPPFRD